MGHRTCCRTDFFSTLFDDAASGFALRRSCVAPRTVTRTGTGTGNAATTGIRAQPGLRARTGATTEVCTQAAIETPTLPLSLTDTAAVTGTRIGAETGVSPATPTGMGTRNAANNGAGTCLRPPPNIPHPESAASVEDSEPHSTIAARQSLSRRHRCCFAARLGNTAFFGIDGKPTLNK